MQPMSRFLAVLLTASMILMGAAPSVHAQSIDAAEQSSDIVMYVLPDCGYCERARQYLQARGLDWREVDIASSAQAKAEFDARGGVGTPLILVGSEQMTGFDVARLEQLLD